MNSKLNPLVVSALAALALALAGCGSQEPASPEKTPAVVSSASTAASTVAYDEGTINKGDKARCAVCIAKEGGMAEETVAETIDYKGKTYAFCNEGEKAEFIAEPTKYAAK